MMRQGRLVQRRDSQDALGVGGGVGPTDQEARLVDDVVPGLVRRASANRLEGL